jgi:hypothetical protein
VDGRRVTRRVSIAAGDHVVQVGTGAVITTRIRLSPGDEATLVVPGALDASALGWALDAEKRGALQGALAAVIGEGFQVYVVAGEEVLRHTTGEDAWAPVRAAAPVDPPRDPSPPPADPVEPDPEPGPTDPTVAREPRRLWWLLPPGVGAIAFGGGYGTHAWLQARKVHKAAGEATDRTEYDALTADYARWGRRLTTAEIVGGIGVAVTVAGLAVKVEGAELAPLLGPDTVGVGLRVRR